MAALMYINEVHALGLNFTRTCTSRTAGPGTRTRVSPMIEALFEKMKKMPSSVQAASYSAVYQYLSAVKALGTDDADKVMATALEDKLAADAVFASNTSSLRIDDIARPDLGSPHVDEGHQEVRRHPARRQELVLPHHGPRVRHIDESHRDGGLIERCGASPPLSTTRSSNASAASRAQAPCRRAGLPNQPPWGCGHEHRTRDVAHKTESGGVRLGLCSAEAVREARAAILQNVKATVPHAQIDGVVVQPMAGVELIVGSKLDPVFGPFIVVGLGGIFVELMKGVGFRIAPVSIEEATGILRSLRGAKVFEVFRGMEAVDLSSVAGVVGRDSELAAELANAIEEIDVNPRRALSQPFPSTFHQNLPLQNRRYLLQRTADFATTGVFGPLPPA